MWVKKNKPSPPGKKQSPAIGREFQGNHRNAAASSASRDTQILNTADLVDKVEPSIVRIITDTSQLGSGFVVNINGLIVTNYPAIEGASRATVKFSNGLSTEIAGYVAVDKGRDLAVLRINTSKEFDLRAAVDPFNASEEGRNSNGVRLSKGV